MQLTTTLYSYEDNFEEENLLVIWSLTCKVSYPISLLMLADHCSGHDTPAHDTWHMTVVMTPRHVSPGISCQSPIFCDSHTRSFLTRVSWCIIAGLRALSRQKMCTQGLRQMQGWGAASTNQRPGEAVRTNQKLGRCDPERITCRQISEWRVMRGADTGEETTLWLRMSKRSHCGWGWSGDHTVTEDEQETTLWLRMSRRRSHWDWGWARGEHTVTEDEQDTTLGLRMSREPHEFEYDLVWPEYSSIEMLN